MPDIAIVDDDSPVCNAISRALGDAGFQMRVFHDPLVALPHLMCQPPRLLVLNGKMPGMHGIEFFRRFRPYSRCPVVFLSASAEEIEETLRRQDHPAEVYIAKPFSMGHLVATCQRLIEAAAPGSCRAAVDP
jgi:DNA-binding response OmpR family regulator